MQCSGRRVKSTPRRFPLRRRGQCSAVAMHWQLEPLHAISDGRNREVRRSSMAACRGLRDVGPLRHRRDPASRGECCNRHYTNSVVAQERQ